MLLHSVENSQTYNIVIKRYTNEKVVWSKHIIMSQTFICLIVIWNCDKDFLLIHYNGEWQGKKSARVYTPSLYYDLIRLQQSQGMPSLSCFCPVLSSSPFPYHVSVVNGFSQSIYYFLTLISRHLSALK